MYSHLGYWYIPTKLAQYNHSSSAFIYQDINNNCLVLADFYKPAHELRCVMSILADSDTNSISPEHFQLDYMAVTLP